MAGVVFSNSPGTAAPPATLGPYTMTPFGLDNVNPINPYGATTPNTASVATPAIACGGSIGFLPLVDHRRIGTSFLNWSHGYTGDVYLVDFPAGGGPPSATITLPAGTGAFYFYATPIAPGAAYSIQATANDGTTSGPIPITGLDAKYYGFYASPGCVLTSITVSNTTAGTSAEVVIGEFGIACLDTKGPQNVAVSDQKAGSMLVFPYYTNVGQADTRIQITNAGVDPAKVHIMLLDKSCQQLDYYACITPNGSLIDKASVFDPTNSGYIIALAVDDKGQPIIANNLIGNAFVNDGDYVGNYGAEAFWGGAEYMPTAAANNAKTDTADLVLKAPCEFSVEIQSPKDAVQRLLMVGLQGDVNMMTVSGAAQSGTGFAYNAQEQGGSFQKLLTGSCFSDAVITNTFPRVPTTLGTTINAGNAGHLRFSIGAGVGLLLTGKSSKSGLSGIRTLHKTKTTQVTLTVPVFMPTC